MERFRKAAGPLAAVLLVILLGGWHAMQTWAGAAGSGDIWLMGNYWLLFALLLLALAAMGALLFMRKQPIERCALLGVLVLGSGYLFVMAPLSAPDEIGHFMSAYAVSNTILGQPSVNGDGYVRIREEDDFIQNIYRVDGTDQARVSLGRELDEETYRLIKEKSGPLFVGKQEMMDSVYQPVNTTPVAYLVPALGISLARLLRVNCIALVYIGRYFNLIFFAVFSWLAMRKLPFGKEILFGVLLLPMTLHQAASFSYDAFVMALCFFFGAYCLELAFVKDRVRKRDLAVLMLVIAALAPCKFVYVVVMGLAFLIPIKKFGGKKQWAVSVGVVLIICLAAILIVSGKNVSSFASGEDNLVSWAGTEGFSFPLLLHNPLLYAQIMYRTLFYQFNGWWFSMLGSSLGNLDPVLSTPSFLLLGMTACLGVLSIRKAGEALYLTGKQKAWILFLTAACLLGFMTAMLLAWTPLSSLVVEGVQGRYLLPMLPFALMTGKGKNLVRTDGDDRKILFYLCAMDCYVLLSIFSIVSMRL